MFAGLLARSSPSRPLISPSISSLPLFPARHYTFESLSDSPVASSVKEKKAKPYRKHIATAPPIPENGLSDEDLLESLSKSQPRPINPPTSFTAPVWDIRSGRKTGNTVQLDPRTSSSNSTVFGAPVRPDIMHRVVVWKLACKRLGTATVKTRAEVKASRKKMAPQKGRGRARVGDASSPIRRGGGKAHGKRPRDFSYTLPKKVRRMGLQSALSSKFAHGKLLIVNDLELPDYRTNPFYKNVRRFGWSNGVIVDDGSEKSLNLRIAANNIQIFNAVPQTALSVYNILKAKILIIPLSSLQYLSDRVHGRLPRQIKRKLAENDMVVDALTDAEAEEGFDGEDEEAEEADIAAATHQERTQHL